MKGYKIIISLLMFIYGFHSNLYAADLLSEFVMKIITNPSIYIEYNSLEGYYNYIYHKQQKNKGLINIEYGDDIHNLNNDDKYKMTYLLNYEEIVNATQKNVRDDNHNINRKDFKDKQNIFLGSKINFLNILNFYVIDFIFLISPTPSVISLTKNPTTETGGVSGAKGYYQVIYQHYVPFMLNMDNKFLLFKYGYFNTSFIIPIACKSAIYEIKINGRKKFNDVNDGDEKDINIYENGLLFYFEIGLGLQLEITEKAQLSIGYKRSGIVGDKSEKTVIKYFEFSFKI